jgi:site-specific DNA recombinase
MTSTRALGVIRKSNKPGEASTSLPRQREIIENFCEAQGYDLVGVAEDVAKSAFHIPPEKRKAIAAWLKRPDDFDCIVYWRQDRLVRRAFDFIGLVEYCKTHGKALYSATEGTGDASRGEGVLVGFIKAWQAEQESENTGARVRDVREGWEAGRWGGGRVPYGFRSVCACHGKGKCPDTEAVVPFPGYRLVPDSDGTARVVTEAAHRVIAGESVHAVTADFNLRGVRPADAGRDNGYCGRWKQWVLRKILRNPALLNGILTAQEYGQLQLALDERAVSRTVRTTGRDSALLDVMFCGRCGGKIYRWKRGEVVWARCRNHALRSEAAAPCNLPQVRYEVLESVVRQDVLTEHGDDLIEVKVTDALRQARIDAIDRELISLAGKLAARQVDRADFTGRQAELLDERDSLESAASAPAWQRAGETVRERWERLSGAERRLWLLRIGTTYTADRITRTEGGKKIAEWKITSSWRPASDQGYRERVVRPDTA